MADIPVPVPVPVPDKTMFIVFYDEKAEVIDVHPWSECKKEVFPHPKDEIPVAFLNTKGKHCESKSTPILRVHGSPGCWIIVGGVLYCICCP